MWLKSKDERNLLRCYYKKQKNEQPPHSYHHVELMEAIGYKRLQRHLSPSLQTKIEDIKRRCRCCIENNKDKYWYKILPMRIQQWINNLLDTAVGAFFGNKAFFDRVTEAHGRLKERSLVESSDVGVLPLEYNISLTTKGWDVGCKYISKFDTLGLWSKEHKDHIIIVILLAIFIAVITTLISWCLNNPKVGPK